MKRSKNYACYKIEYRSVSAHRQTMFTCGLPMTDTSNKEMKQYVTCINPMLIARLRFLPNTLNTLDTYLIHPLIHPLIIALLFPDNFPDNFHIKSAANQYSKELQRNEHKDKKIFFFKPLNS